MKKNQLKLIVWIVAFQGIGFLSGLLTRNNMSWYQGLNKSSLTPPGVAFSIVWPVLYIFLAVVGWHLWQRRDRQEMRLARYCFFGQLFMNWAWTPIFFHLHMIGFGFFWLLVLSGLTFATINFLKNKFMLLLLIPYLLWLFFASYLNGVIWLFN
jgi:tryptophan-rich sensory protein